VSSAWPHGKLYLSLALKLIFQRRLQNFYGVKPEPQKMKSPANTGGRRSPGDAALNFLLCQVRTKCRASLIFAERITFHDILKDCEYDQAVRFPIQPTRLDVVAL
jgi:hypothetical protein